jgi:hypothetical protein
MGNFRPSLNMTTYFDERWIGPHGIGRFTSEVVKRIGFLPAGVSGQLLSMQDPWSIRHRLLQLKPAHYFSPGFNPPIGKPCSFSLTVHDLIHLEVAEERSFAKHFFLRATGAPQSWWWWSCRLFL